MIKKIFYFHLFYVLLLTSCGFKVVNNEKDQKLNIIKIEASGENRINYILKNNLKNISKDDEKKIIIKIKTNKKRIINEKNIKNEITKYELIIDAETNYNLIEENKNGKFTISKNGIYDVNNQYSRTINNEKNLTNTLTEEITEEIINTLYTIINDL